MDTLVLRLNGGGDGFVSAVGVKPMWADTLGGAGVNSSPRLVAGYVRAFVCCLERW